MIIKVVKPIRFLYYRTETKVNELNQFLPVGQALIKEAVENDLAVTGPVHWHYHGFTGDVEQPFTLEVCLPVSEVLADYDGEFHFKVTESYKCVSVIHEGNWLEIPGSYGKLMSFIQSNQLMPIGSNRELYINVDFKLPEANVTEIQMGIL